MAERVYKKGFLRLREEKETQRSGERKPVTVKIRPEQLMELDIAVQDSQQGVDRDVKNAYDQARRELGSAMADSANYVVDGSDVNESAVAEKAGRALAERVLRGSEDAYDAYHDAKGRLKAGTVMEEVGAEYKKVTGKELVKENPVYAHALRRVVENAVAPKGTFNGTKKDLMEACKAGLSRK